METKIDVDIVENTKDSAKTDNTKITKPTAKRSPRSKKTTTKQSVSNKDLDTVTGVDNVDKKEKVVEDAVQLKDIKQQAKKLVPKDIDPEQYVTVVNGFQGRLVYISGRTGERFIWDEFGAEQEIELRELKNAKNSYKQFFENNWFMFNEDWIVDYLGVQRFYRNAVKIEDFDDIFKNDADEIKRIISEMSDGQKKSVAYRARILIANGEIDSNKSIKTLEETLGLELVEK